ncbi:multiple sugar transport system ATP-binding protein [Andreprevotia lacus DSM 23236]|jgi:multiple sugar transport system ATP-binding protein|uniref:Multiple sugar transport system ATP-binding protein n=1 Tax=Andreprevotia lacus DSM 23236 TaxID=1121001 RepID=A0A1W1X7I4_9NEIS|nr:sn-glycerol-3-phosphate ABC transporter ATP-binding protein UgpC [Andreprevotia lacus]SMC19793.1 multiple sugar transport system ATP-binding protein [Andreprevotia lacus DSM 23236]
MASVTLKGIKKNYTKDVQVIKGVDLEIKDGEFVVFVGPSGCGKSTLLRMIAGLEDITEGSLYIGDTLSNDIHASKRGIAMVFQSYALYPHMSVADNMAFALKLAGTAKEEIAQRVNKAAEILQITHLLERKPKALSGGQRQRVAIGRAIVRNPKVFLFDEPLSNLDASLRLNMRVELSKLHQDLGTTMIYVTHDQVEAMTLADRIVVFNAGIIQQVGSPLDLYENPSNLFVAGFLGSPKMNLLKAQLVGVEQGIAVVRLPKGVTLRAAVDAKRGKVGDEVTLGIRPEHLRVASMGEAGAVPARVDLIEHLGDHVLAYIEIPGINDILSLKLPGHTTELKYGDSIHVLFPEDDCLLFDSEGIVFNRVRK